MSVRSRSVGTEPSSLPRVFISYRRVAGSYLIGRIRDRLGMEFGESNVFFDVESIPLGVDFREFLKDEIERSDVVIAIIDPDFMESDLESRHAYVYFELHTALSLGKPLFPVRVSGAPDLASDRLPPALQALAQRQSLQLRPDPDFGSDISRLVAGIKHRVPPQQPDLKPEPQPKPKSKAKPKSTEGRTAARLTRAQTTPTTKQAVVVGGHVQLPPWTAPSPEGAVDPTWLSGTGRLQPGLVEFISKIVAKEGPITMDRLSRLVCEGAGVRSTESRRGAVLRAASAMARNGALTNTLPFRGAGDHERTLTVPRTPLAVPRARGPRYHYEIPYVEIAEVARLLLVDSPRRPVDSLVKELGRAFETRLTDATRDRFMTAIQHAKRGR